MTKVTVKWATRELERHWHHELAGRQGLLSTIQLMEIMGASRKEMVELYERQAQQYDIIADELLKATELVFDRPDGIIARVLA
jgi:hypothetical protein